MATWTSTGLSNSSRFKAAQSTVSTANSVTELAVQYQRYHNTATSTGTSILNASPPVPCWPGSSTSSLLLPNNNVDLTVWCSMLWFFGSPNPTRIVTFSTCLSTISPAACASAPLLQAVVYYDDYKAGGGANTCTYGHSGGTCGVDMAIHSWVFVPIPPAVTGVNVPGTIAPPCITTKNFTLYGTGFSSPPQVYFIVQGTSNFTAYPASNVSVGSSGVITGCEPTAPTGLATGTTAAVIVTTPTGTSPFNLATGVTTWP